MSSVIKWSGSLRAKENSGIADLSEHWQMEPAAWPLHSFYCDCDDTIDAIEKDMEMAVCEDSDDEMNMIVMQTVMTMIVMQAVMTMTMMNWPTNHGHDGNNGA